MCTKLMDAYMYMYIHVVHCVVHIEFLCIHGSLCANRVCRQSEENFEEVHGRLKRGDVIGVTGCPGELGAVYIYTCIHVAYALFDMHTLVRACTLCHLTVEAV